MEFVFVIKREQIAPFVLPDGFARLAPAEGAALGEHLATRGFFVERQHAEGDRDFKQIIPYCLISSGERLLAVRRLEQQSEARLHGLWSIGIGGHIDPEDKLPSSQNRTDEDNEGSSIMATRLFDRAVRRELHEELVCPTAISPRLVGWINDDSNAVGAVHLGIAYLLLLSEQEVGIRETERMEGGFTTPEEIASRDREFETWSRLVFHSFHPRGVPHLVEPAG